MGFNRHPETEPFWHPLWRCWDIPLVAVIFHHQQYRPYDSADHDYTPGKLTSGSPGNILLQKGETSRRKPWICWGSKWWVFSFCFFFSSVGITYLFDSRFPGIPTSHNLWRTCRVRKFHSGQCPPNWALIGTMTLWYVTIAAIYLKHVSMSVWVSVRGLCVCVRHQCVCVCVRGTGAPEWHGFHHENDAILRSLQLSVRMFEFRQGKSIKQDGRSRKKTHQTVSQFYTHIISFHFWSDCFVCTGQQQHPWNAAPTQPEPTGLAEPLTMARPVVILTF